MITNAAAPTVLDPLFLKKHSVIDKKDILFKFRISIKSIMGKIANIVLICLISMLSTNVSDSPRTRESNPYFMTFFVRDLSE